jgi:hypothetical protein
MSPYVKKTADPDEEAPEIPRDIEDKLNNALVFAVIWGIGGCLNEETRPKFDLFFQDMINGLDVIQKYNIDMEGKHSEI